jgi:hypothetical protein
MSRVILLLPLLLGAACVPDLSSDDARVTVPRILAVRAEPAEAEPGSSVMFTALVAGPQGSVEGPPIAWSFCEAPKPLTEDNVVSTACLDAKALLAVGNGASVTATTPGNGCSLFGPDPPPGAVRPRDPDATGGYYQPLRADLPGWDPTFALARIRCNLANASAASAMAFANAYVPNENPKLLPLATSAAGIPVSLDALKPGARVDLVASWPPPSAETYAYYDPAFDAVGIKREALSVAWYASSGTLDRESTGRAEDDPATSSSNSWTAPTTGGTTYLWIVLRDNRGGVDFETYEARVR